MTKGNVLIITRKIGSSNNLETQYLAGELISSITIGSYPDGQRYVKVEVPSYTQDVPLFLFGAVEDPENFQAVMKYLKNLGQFPIMGKKQEDSNPLVV